MVLKVKLNQSVVRKAIAKRNMSQNMLAIKLGTSSGYLSQIFCGTRYPSPKMREKLQSVLAPLTFDDIFIIEESGDETKN